MNLHDLSPDAGSRTKSIRVGRGSGGRRGESCGRGEKGQKKRNTVHPYFEGGQTPLYRRVPKFGFNPPNSTTVEVINLYQLNRFDDGETVDVQRLQEEGLVDGNEAVKLLGDGNLDVEELTIQVHEWSSSAQEALEQADGDVEPLNDRD